MLRFVTDNAVYMSTDWRERAWNDLFNGIPCSLCSILAKLVIGHLGELLSVNDLAVSLCLYIEIHHSDKISARDSVVILS